jgi:hypothetical protein
MLACKAQDCVTRNCSEILEQDNTRTKSDILRSYVRVLATLLCPAQLSGVFCPAIVRRQYFLSAIAAAECRIVTSIVQTLYVHRDL